MLSKRSKQYLQDLKTVMKTNAGKRVLKNLKETYVDTSALGDSVLLTGYKLGQKELIESLMLDSSLDITKLESIETIIE